ncbi:hypothetical protein KCP75_24735 [Salmonella enterica subsp. enterica]|nr:hypothetical protein KCP75_24735 [Salmonella enterica subsp. enterica]
MKEVDNDHRIGELRLIFAGDTPAALLRAITGLLQKPHGVVRHHRRRAGSQRA